MTEDDYKTFTNLVSYNSNIKDLELSKNMMAQLIHTITEDVRCSEAREDWGIIQDVMFQIAYSPLRREQDPSIQFGNYARLVSEIESMLDFEIGRLKDEVKKIEERITIRPLEDEGE